jgi:anti-sigma factor RsiW
MHLNDEQIQRRLHGELPVTGEDELARHLAGCAECARRVDAAEQEERAILALLGEIDHPAPALDMHAFDRPRRRVVPAWGRRVAAAVLVLGLAGAASAIPGSPVRELARFVTQLITGHGEPAPAERAPVTREPVTAGISVPAGESFTIHFRAEQTGGVAVVSWTDGATVAVRAQGGNAIFTTDTGELGIDNSGSAARYEIDVPRSVRRFEITIGTTRALLLDENDLDRSQVILPLGPQAVRK